MFNVCALNKRMSKHETSCNLNKYFETFKYSLFIFFVKSDHHMR